MLIPMLSCDILTDEAEIERLIPAWDALQAAVGLSPFSSASWVRAWYDSVGRPGGATIMIVVCREGEEVRGLLPMAVTPNALGLRVLRFAGHDVFYIRNLLARDEAALAAMWAALARAKGYDCADIKNIHEGSPEEKILAGMATKVASDSIYFCAHAGETSDALWASRPKRERRKVKKIEETVRGEPSFSYEIIEDASVLDEAVPFLVEKKTAWCEQNGKRGIFRTPYAAAFYKALSVLAAREKTLRLLCLRKGGALAGLLLCVRYKDTLFNHTVAYDPALLAFMPGLFLNVETINLACKEGLAETNFMEGPERFKKELSTGFRPVRKYMFARTLRGRLFVWTYKLRLRLRRRREAA